MSARYRFELATEADDAALRSRMARDRLDGSIAVSFRREPSYFAGCRVQGERTQVVKCVDAQRGELALVGSRSISTVYVDGEPRSVGYLADLRLAPEYRRGLLFRGANRFLRTLHAGDPVPFYLCVIYEGNAAAFETLTAARAGLPTLRDAGRLLTPAIALDVPRRAIAVEGVRIVRATPALLPAIVEFLNASQRAKQFAPLYSADDFPLGRFRGLRAEDFFVALAGTRVVGTLAAWDQAAIRQTHVEGYSGVLRAVRPLYNALAHLTPLKPLPAPGGRIPSVALSCAAVQGNDPALFRALLRTAYNGLRGGRWHYAILGLHERDPLAAVLTEYRRVRAAGRLFTVHLDGAAGGFDGDRVPFMEAGCL